VVVRKEHTPHGEPQEEVLAVESSYGSFDASDSVAYEKREANMAPLKGRNAHEGQHRVLFADLLVGVLSLHSGNLRGRERERERGGGEGILLTPLTFFVSDEWH
jgi:hypothetical protein